jgi:hypothetical protein
VNMFYGECPYTEDEIRNALRLSPAVPLVWCDARDRQSSKLALIKLIRHAMDRLPVRTQPVT